MPPTLFIKNALRLADLGLGDGTIYASATGATPNVSQKTFALAGLSIIADIGADADDKFNGHILYFPASGNRYQIVDWVAATDTATTYENPAATDTGACEVRRALVSQNQLAGNPAKFLADGQRYIKWRTDGGNPNIQIHLPNAIQNGGFESGVLSPWAKYIQDGTTDATGVNAAAPILGKNDLKINIGDRSFVVVYQAAKFRFEKGRTYRFLFRGRYSGVYTTSQFIVSFGVGINAYNQNVTLSNASSGTVLDSTWTPLLTAGNVWHFVDVTFNETYDQINTTPNFRLNSSAFDVFIDEIYYWEKVNVGALLLFEPYDPNTAYISAKVDGYYCPTDRSSLLAGTDSAELASFLNAGADIVWREFTGGIFPVYTIQNVPGNGAFLQASEILLAEAWTWKFPPELPVDPEQEEYDESVVTSRSGVVRRYLHAKRRKFAANLAFVDPIDVPIWKGGFKTHHLDPAHPFAAKYTGFWGDRPVLWRNLSPGFRLDYRAPNYPDMKIDWEEVK